MRIDNPRPASRWRRVAFVAALAVVATLLVPVAAMAACAGYSKPPEYPPVAPRSYNATEYSRVISAEEAAKLGIKFSSTGGVTGENVRVDPRYMNLDAPVRVKMNIEVTPASYAARVKAELEAGLKQAEAVGAAGLPPGQRLQFEINVKPGGAEPTLNYHQVTIVDDPSWRSITQINKDDSAGSAVWSTNNADGSWTHEALHMMGLDDRYDDYFIPRKGKAVKLPSRGMTDAEIAKYLKQYGLKLSDGKCKSKRDEGADGDLMANSGGLHQGAGIIGPDRGFIVGRGDGSLTVTAKPGDVLGSKDPTKQSYGVGGAGEVTVTNPSAPGATKSQAGTQENGIFVYCIDLHRASPAEGQVMDVLGPASQIPASSMQALQRVLEVIGRRQPERGASTPGAQAAVWRVTDNEAVSPENTDAQAILAEAGIAPDAQFEEHHFTSPNAGSPDTGSISPAGGPAPRVLPTQPPSYLKGAKLKSKRIRVRGRRAGVRLSVKLDVAGNDERVRASIMPRSAKRPQLPFETFEPRKVRAGGSTLKLSAKWLLPGRYTLVVRGLRGDKELPFTVLKKRKRR